METIYIIKWGQDYFDNYNYGSEISFDSKGRVLFSSPLMPPSALIKTWYSKTAFHANRKSPSLPLLLHGEEYEFRFKVTNDNGFSLKIRIDFFDIRDEKIGEELFSKNESSFIFPMEAQSYQISLLNTRHEQIKFDYLLIGRKHVFSLNDIYVNEDLNVIEICPKASYDKISIVLSKERKISNTSFIKENTLLITLFLDKENIAMQLLEVIQLLEKKKREDLRCFIEKGYLFSTTDELGIVFSRTLSILLPESQMFNMVSLHEKNQEMELMMEVLIQANNFAEQVSDALINCEERM